MNGYLVVFWYFDTEYVYPYVISCVPLMPEALRMCCTQSSGPWKARPADVLPYWICRRVLISSTGDTIKLLMAPAYAPAAAICHSSSSLPTPAWRWKKSRPCSSKKESRHRSAKIRQNK